MESQRIHDLQQKLQDPRYLSTAIQEMAQKLAVELFPRIYHETPQLKEAPRSDFDERNRSD